MPSRRSRLRRILLRTLLAGFLSLSLVALVGFFVIRYFADQTPDWWQPPDLADPRTVETAKAVENGVTTVLHQQHDGVKPWTMRLSEQDANAWLTSRLRDWVESQEGNVEWPSQLSHVLLDLRPDALTLGASVSQRQGDPTILSATLAPRVDADGSFWLPATSFHVGQLSVPSAWVLSSSDSPLHRILPRNATNSPDFASVIDVLRGDKPLSREPTFRLSDGRRVRVVNIKVETEQLLVTCQESPEKHAE